MGGKPKWMEREFEAFSTKFGGASRDKLPFTHCGVRHSVTDRGLKQDQDEFCQKLKPYPLS